MSEPTVLQTITIPAEEWERVYRLGGLSTMDERLPLGSVRLHTIGGLRCWDVTDSLAAARLITESDSHEYDVLVPHSVVRYGLIAAGSGTETTLQFSIDESLAQYVTLAGAGGSVTVDQPDHSIPDLDALLTAPAMPASQATVTGGLLYGLTKASRYTRYPLEEDEEGPDYLFTIGNHTASVDIEWPEVGTTTYRVTAVTTGEPTSRVIAPRVLEHIVRQFKTEDDVVISMPVDDSDPVVFVGPGLSAALLPQRDADPVRERIEAIIEEAVDVFGVAQDEHGNYLLHRKVLPVLGRLDDDEPGVFRVFAALLREVAESAELLSELNDLNRNLGFARLVHADNQVLAAIDLPATTMIALELEEAIDRVVDIGERVMPMLAAVYGGHEAIGPETEQWDSFRSMRVEAEVRPGRNSLLTGKSASSTWPFPGPVFVLSGWNPQGVSMGEEASDSVNAMIAQDILRFGGRFVHGCARITRDNEDEPSLIAWNLSREDAMTIGRKASRTAIFRIDEDEVRVLSCTDDRTIAWRRRP